MKVLALIVCVSVFCGLVTGTAINRDLHKECQADKATHLDENIMKALDEGEITDRAKVGAHLLCISTKAGVINQDGSINKNMVKEKFSRYYSDAAELERITNKCSQQGTTPVETALKLAECINEYSLEQ
ncbi:uncharacterized protein LOC108906305 [Anoplophora glabripennis]|uniref:uncharacterized protein LOC108906305 n=1 Tax=Anoplophora glabripennis TaxID=217634 RepID=UPI000874B128|nr:uncharacterized protein LOC108906305 [Anoplophora glabripennis]